MKKSVIVGIIIAFLLILIFIFYIISNNNSEDINNIDKISSQSKDSGKIIKSKEFIIDCNTIKDKIQSDPSLEQLISYCKFVNTIKSNNFSECNNGVFQDKSECIFDIILKNDNDIDRCKEYEKITGRIFGEQHCIIAIVAKTSNSNFCINLKYFAKKKCEAYSKKDISFCENYCKDVGDNIECPDLGLTSTRPKTQLPSIIDSCIIDIVEKTGNFTLCNKIQREISKEGCILSASKLANNINHCEKSSNKDNCIFLSSILTMTYYCNDISDELVKKQCELFFI